ncbi:unnamed protein product [Auanema sp. JU1783]|nr:unnamed protein product [Auanema sp. JU1783]
MLHFNPNKAGMEGIDKDKVNKVIADSTSAQYSSFTAKQQQRVDQKVREIKKRLQVVTDHEWKQAENEMDQLIAKLEATRDLSRHCVHIDMDAYFAAVEMRDDPKLRSIPMAVGCMAMLGTSNYLARKFGVRAAMPGFIAKRLCPELEIVNGNYDKYRKESRVFSEIFSLYDPEMSMGSLDEAYIDLTEYMETRTESRVLTRKRYGGECVCWLPLIKPDEIVDSLTISKEVCKKCEKERLVYEDSVEFGTSRDEVVREIRFQVEQNTGLTCSAGIATNFMLAKICSDQNKPNGQFELANEYNPIMDFLRELPIRKVSGIGRVSEAHLLACGVKTVFDLLDKRVVYKFVFSPLAQESFIRIGLGLPGRPRVEDSRRKSMSVERTFSPTSSESELMLILRRVSEELMSDVGKKSYIVGGKCVTVKIKLSSFDVLTRSQTLPEVVTDLEIFYNAVSDILKKELGQEIRLLGVRLSQLKFIDDGSTSAHSSKTVLDYFGNAKRSKLDEEDDEEIAVSPTKSNTPDELMSEESTDSLDVVQCPICLKKLRGDNDKLNQHIDECLNSDVLRGEGVVEKPRTEKEKPKITQKATSRNQKNKLAAAEKRGIKRFFTSV